MKREGLSYSGEYMCEKICKSSKKLPFHIIYFPEKNDLYFCDDVDLNWLNWLYFFILLRG